MKLAKIEAALRVVLAFNEAFNRHDVPAMMQWMSEDCLFENTYPPPDGTPYRGKKVLHRFWEQFFKQSPQARIEVEEVFGMGERCVMRWKYSWVDEEGNSGHVRGVDVYRVRDGLICEKLSYVKG